MTEFLSAYGLFLAKTLTIIIGLLFSLIASLAILGRDKSSHKTGNLEITPISQDLEDLRTELHSETLDPAERKSWRKAEHKRQKKQAKIKEKAKPRLFVLRFEGDMKASDVDNLREEITAIILVAKPQDEVLLILESAGGFVHSYGLAASQCHRLREHKLPLTIAIDKVAASGGYLMACVANTIIAAPFAIVGSIGVVAQIPNFHRLLSKNDIDYEILTAGEYKRTLTVFGENTEKAREKFTQELNQTHDLFKNFIHQHRSFVDLHLVATGEHWHAIDAIHLKLVDALQTSDDFILQKSKSMNIFEVSYHIKPSLAERLTGGFIQAWLKVLGKLGLESQPFMQR